MGGHMATYQRKIRHCFKGGRRRTKCPGEWGGNRLKSYMNSCGEVVIWLCTCNLGLGLSPSLDPAPTCTKFKFKYKLKHIVNKN
jgi:hypothetical protein